MLGVFMKMGGDSNGCVAKENEWLSRNGGDFGCWVVFSLSKSYVYEIFSTPLYFMPVTMLSLPNIKVVRLFAPSILIEISIERKTSFGTLSKLSDAIFSGSASSTFSVVIGTSSIFSLFASATTLNVVTAIAKDSAIEISLRRFIYLVLTSLNFKISAVT